MQMVTTDFPAVCQHLRAVLAPYAPQLVVKTDSDTLYYNFKQIDESMLEELGRLVQTSFKCYQAEGWV
jgi:hypothetical protein